MKACRQIQKEHSILKHGLISCKRFGNVVEECCKNCQFNAGWRAALKWAKAMHDMSSEPRFSMNIKEELEDERI